MRYSFPLDDRYQRLWQSKGLVFFLLLVLVFMSISVMREIFRRLEIRHEIEQIESEVARLEQRNSEMRDVIALFSTSAVQEKEARVKLGVQRPTEQVLFFPDRTEEKEIILPDADRIAYIPVRDYAPNPQKWFHFFWNKISPSL